MEEQRAVKREEAKTCRKEEQAEHPRKSPEEVEAERQSTRKFLFDETGKPYDAAILRHLAQEGDGEKGGGYEGKGHVTPFLRPPQCVDFRGLHTFTASGCEVHLPRVESRVNI